MEQNVELTEHSAPASSRTRLRLFPFELPDGIKAFLRNKKAMLGSTILLFFILVSLFASTIAPVDERRGANKRVGPPHEPPSVEALQDQLVGTFHRTMGREHTPCDCGFAFGTTRTGQDVFAQIVHGTKVSLMVGFGAGTFIIGLCILIGITAGYVGGWVDEILSLLTNVFLVIPGLPLIIVVAGWVEQPGPTTVALVLAATSWAYGARVLRSQTLVLRNSEFVAAARVTGEPSERIILFEILPNMIALVFSAWIGAVVFVILTEATLSFIGLGNPSAVSWGTSLYWAQNNQALLTRAWWTFIPPGVCIALVGFSLTLINYGVDEISNPRLQKHEGAKKRDNA